MRRAELQELVHQPRQQKQMRLIDSVREASGKFVRGVLSGEAQLRAPVAAIEI